MKPTIEAVAKVSAFLDEHEDERGPGYEIWGSAIRPENPFTIGDLRMLWQAATSPDMHVMEEVLDEITSAHLKFGPQTDVPDGTGGHDARAAADDAREDCQDAFAAGLGTWWHILLEEVYEALAEDDPAALRKELLQVAAVAIRWVDAIDNREQVST